MVNKDNPSEDDIKKLFVMAKQWVNLFTSLGASCQGYRKEKVTPYMHTMVYHYPKLMQMHCGIRKFSDQGVEKKK